MDVQRTRTMDRRVPSYVDEVFTNIYTNLEETGRVQKGLTGSHSVITDVRHSGFNRRIEQGEIMIGPLELGIQSREVLPDSFSWVSYHTNYKQTGDLFPGTVAPAGGTYPRPNVNLLQDLDVLAQEAAQKAYAKMNGSTVGGGEMLRELGGTIQMLRRPMSGVRSLVCAAHEDVQRWANKKPQIRRKKQMLADAYADSWLELQYGLLPLAGDAMKLMERFTDGSMNLSRDRFVARAKASKSYTLSEAFSGTQYGDYHILNGMVVNGIRSTDIRLTADVGVIYGFRNNSQTDLYLQTFGLRGSDLFATAWNIVPLSFVVDWFVNVDGWLKASYLDPNLVILGEWTTSIQREINSGSGSRVITRNRVSENGQQSELVTSSGSGGGERITTTIIRRTPSVDLPDTPVVDLEFRSLRHAISGLALMNQNIVSVLKKFIF